MKEQAEAHTTGQLTRLSNKNVGLYLLRRLGYPGPEGHQPPEQPHLSLQDSHPRFALHPYHAIGIPNYTPSEEKPVSVHSLATTRTTHASCTAVPPATHPTLTPWAWQSETRKDQLQRRVSSEPRAGARPQKKPPRVSTNTHIPHTRRPTTIC